MRAWLQDPTTGDTALHEAARFCRVELMEMLLGYGADPYVKNQEVPFEKKKKKKKKKEGRGGE